ncbi:EF-P lysine aminoacylase EpmA [Methylobrevis albus]|uniref:EF-P lysine aminoacylase GenX n=1 Tax=Methylobrevis albus TaxID=2793297 RepID=A0A931MWD0_9HYPH|nr:EF-P lysine aminoacylase EpmA [Methylobrevis albus]MBH0236678.1 EF-P lysine aminoacylase GenX [Methylobrevis albus]
MIDASPWWSKHVHADRRPFLEARGRIRRAVRDWFEARGFTETECAALQVSPGNEAHLHGFATNLTGPDATVVPMHLHTSPEFAMKKLLAAGERRIFDFARVFRNRECGPLHHPEFTLLEWYRADEPYEVLMDDCAALLAVAAHAAGTTILLHRRRSADPFAVPERLTVADAFTRFAGIDLLATLAPDPRADPDRDHLARLAAASGYRVAGDDSWTDIYSRILVESIEPNLGHDRATLLYEYPVCEAALSRPTAHDPRVAERFELYACGVELANAFGELTDPAEQRRRFEIEMDEKARVYGERYPLDEEFLAALGAMPAASGIALGFDRLVMLATGAARIDQVVWTPVAG